MRLCAHRNRVTRRAAMAQEGMEKPRRARRPDTAEVELKSPRRTCFLLYER